MKRILISILSGILATGMVFAEDDFAKLKIQIRGVTSNHYFLCFEDDGCMNIAEGNKGRIYPMNAGAADYIYIANMKTLQSVEQKLPGNCNVDIQNNQTMIVSGELAYEAGNKPYIKNLSCNIS